MKRFFVIALTITALGSLPLRAAEIEPGFISLFDGKTFSGWEKSLENPNTWSVEDGAFVARGDWKKTGSIYDVLNVKESPAQDDQWWTQTISVNGDHVIVKVNDTVVTDYTEPPGTQPGKDYTRKLDVGTFALQAHDPKSVIFYKNIRVKRLP